MTQHTLLVCKSCSATIAHDDVEDDTITEGVLLLNQLQELNQSRFENNKLNIQAVGCLWTCDRPCSASLIAAGKYIYHFADLPLESAKALLEFSALYINSDDGYVLPANFPKLIRSKLLVRIPPTPTSEATVSK